MNDLEDIIYELHEAFDEKLLAIEAEEIMFRFKKDELMAFDIEKNFTEPMRKHCVALYKDNPEQRWYWLKPISRKLSFKAKLLLKLKRIERNFFSTKATKQTIFNGPYR